MTCQEFQRLMVDALYGEIHQDDLARLESHRETCPACQEAYRQRQSSFQRLEKLADFPSQEVPSRPLPAPALLAGEAIHARRRMRLWKRLAAAGVVLALGSLIFSATKLRIEVSDRSLTIGYGELEQKTSKPTAEPTVSREDFDLLAANAKRFEESIMTWIQSELTQSRSSTQERLVRLEDDIDLIFSNLSE